MLVESFSCISRAELQAFVDHVAAGGGPLIPYEQLVNVTEASFAAMTSARENRVITLAEGQTAGKDS